MMKKYLNIKEVSKITGLKEHLIRYWDSVDPKTNQLRIGGISTKTKGGTRYFSKDNLNKLQSLKNLLYDNGDHNPSLKLAERILTSSKTSKNQPNFTSSVKYNMDTEKAQKIAQILKKMKILLK